MPASLRALSLDAVGTLIEPAESPARTYARCARARGHPVDEPAFAARLPRAIAALRHRRAGDPRWRAYWQTVVWRTTEIADADLALELYRCFARPQAWRLRPGALDCLDCARARGLSLALISNFDLRLRPLLESLGIAHRFDVIVVSAEVGLEKPDRRVFELAAARLRVEPRELLHVGDSPADDLHGAAAAGCRARLLGGSEGDLPELARWLVAAVEPTVG